MEQLNSTVVISNISSSPGYPSPASWDFRSLAPAVVLSLSFLLGVPGNIAVIILRPNWQQMSRLSQILMLNLAISDLISLLPLPLWIYTLLCSWTLGLVLCKLLAYLAYCSLYSSQMTVTALSVQRYLKVVYLQRYFHHVGLKKLLALLWLAAMILSIHALVHQQLTPDQNWTRCRTGYSSPAQQEAVLLTQTLMGFLCCFVMAFSYIGLHRKVNQAAFFNNPQTTRLITSIIVSFNVLWMPNNITSALGVAAISLKNEGLLKFYMDSKNTAGALWRLDRVQYKKGYELTQPAVDTA
ncbi:hypothetical protein FQN60_015710 [Etheostoma spectabile]|uniref:G-protein coupled receptors family 1 profile domain-containing protein n=1 Tax=Etheostoma spectabile TaxID=54343 RepID=A0A5J5CNR9_9PERO|nr:hypothetical protein FQN60_015710 [Etheostoma spectabile]